MGERLGACREGTDVKGSMGTGHFWNWEKTRYGQSRERLEREAREACRVRIMGPRGHSQEHVEGA